MEVLRFPIGRWEKPLTFDDAFLAKNIQAIAAFPQELEVVLSKMSSEMLQKHYRPDGWTGKQVVHHCSDSNINALIRFKLALTEHEPTIKPYMQQLWAELPDYEAEIGNSLAILKAVHSKWAFLMERMQPKDWQRTYVHPEYGEIFPLYAVASNYAWHGKHHLAHLKLILAKG